MLTRWLRRHQWLPLEGETWAAHSLKLRAQLYPPATPETEEETPEIPEETTPEPVLSKVDRQLLRRKFGIRRGQPDPEWFDRAEYTE